MATTNTHRFNHDDKNYYTGESSGLYYSLIGKSSSDYDGSTATLYVDASNDKNFDMYITLQTMALSSANDTVNGQGLNQYKYYRVRVEKGDANNGSVTFAFANVASR